VKSADNLAREHTETAIRTLAEIMNDEFAEDKDRIKAADTILDRGHGKPSQAIIAIPGNRQMAALLAGKTDDELIALLNQTQLPRLAQSAPVSEQWVDRERDPLLD
jgi:hypothetical protein